MLMATKASEVAEKSNNLFEAAIQEASQAMDKKEGMMRLLDKGVMCLTLLMNVGNSVAAVSLLFNRSSNIVTLVVDQRESSACIKRYSSTLPS